MTKRANGAARNAAAHSETEAKPRGEASSPAVSTELNAETKGSRPKKKRFWHPDGGRLTWQIAYFFPPQGSWTAREFLELESRLLADRPRLELVNGRLEVLPMPIEPHEFIMVFLFEALKAFTKLHAPGWVMPNGIKIRSKKTGKWRFRLPDVLFLKKENEHLRKRAYWDGADLVMEVVSGGKKDRERDFVKKLADYAAAGISEYWIIDPKERFIRVLTLRGTSYAVHGEFRPGDRASSALLPGFSVSVDDVLASANG